MKKYNDKILNEIETIKEVFKEGIKIINKGTKEYEMIKNYVNVTYRDLDCCYNSYSRIKENIYNRYLGIYSNLYDYGFEGWGYGVNSYNIMQFTLCMKLRKDNVIYKIYITKCYNKIIAIEEDEDED